MTLPDERTRAVLMVERFLLNLTSPSKTKGVPSYVREHARMLLRHYPTAHDLAVTNQMCTEPLTKFVLSECPFDHPDNVRLINE